MQKINTYLKKAEKNSLYLHDLKRIRMTTTNYKLPKIGEMKKRIVVKFSNRQFKMVS